MVLSRLFQWKYLYLAGFSQHSWFDVKKMIAKYALNVSQLPVVDFRPMLQRVYSRSDASGCGLVCWEAELPTIQGYGYTSQKRPHC